MNSSTHDLRQDLNQQLSTRPREQKKFYIGASHSDCEQMLKELNLNQLKDVFAHIDSADFLENIDYLGSELGYQELQQHLLEISQLNKVYPSFIGDGLPDFQQMPIVNDICAIRGLTTAYTPYQPERSQGTLQSLWIYQSLLAQLTGFEAINASLYERSTCLFEAIKTAIRLSPKKNSVAIAQTIHPHDWSVLKTLTQDTGLNLISLPVDMNTGLIDQHHLENLLQSNQDIAALVFAQINSLGLIEQVDQLTDLATRQHIKSIAIFDPMLIGTNGLKPPAQYGSQQQGCDMIVAEGQHLAIDPNFGGPGLGIFGIRYNQNTKNDIRSTPGRFVGKAQDIAGRECKAIILSTREQHIRRDKATSNICSNQSFLATLAGATMLCRGEKGFEQATTKARQNAHWLCQQLTSFDGVQRIFNQTPFYNEFVISVAANASELIEQAINEAQLLIGVDITGRWGSEQLIHISCSDKQGKNELEHFVSFFASKFNKGQAATISKIPSEALRTGMAEMPTLEANDIVHYYQRLGQQNVSPDDGIYPLGSCTMKYNPHINDWAASLPGFTGKHPAAPLSSAQGCLHILYSIQEMFKAITGLPGVTTQPVAGAQGELVGLKMFQAYHRDRGESYRNKILIPKSAHGTNPATAVVAGYQVVEVKANETGEMDLTHVQEMIQKYQKEIAGIMVTNPNTAGIFETQFKKIAQLIHQTGGLVYMDGANMNAIAGWIDLNKLGVDAVHNNLHKTWTIPHGGGGPGDAIVAVSNRLIDYLPGKQVFKKQEKYYTARAAKSIGDFHRHWGNFAHKVRAYTYLKALGKNGVKQMSAVAVLSSQYLFKKLNPYFPTLPKNSLATPRMHEFILTLSEEMFILLEAAGIKKAMAIPRIGKLFLDFGFHAPTVAFPEQFGLMIEPTESFNKAELDQFAQTIMAMKKLLEQNPEVLQTVPHFTPIDRVDEVAANRVPQVSERITSKLPEILLDRLPKEQLKTYAHNDLCQKIIEAHQKNREKIKYE